MKKITLFLILTFAGFTITTQAQKNRYLKFTNTINQGGGIFSIPNSPEVNVDATQHKTITFRLMIPLETNNDLNWGRIIIKDGSSVPGNGGYGIVFGGAPGPNKNDLRLITNNTNSLQYGTVANIPAVNLNDGNWHHFALVLNDNSDPARNPAQKAKIYIDGKHFITASNPDNTQKGPIDMTNNANLVFGATDKGGSTVKGMAIDDIRIWDHALTLDEINSDKTTRINASTASMILGLLAAYDFEAEANGSTPDITGKTTKATIIAPRKEGNAITVENGPSTVTTAK